MHERASSIPGGVRGRERDVHRVALAAVALTLLGCAASPTSEPPGPTTTSATSTVPPATLPYTEAMPTPPPVPESSAPAALPPPTGRCHTDQLRLEVRAQGAAAGSLGYALLFTNTAAAPCTMAGYPGVQLGDPAGRPLGDADRAGQDPPAALTLAPGASAGALVVLRNEANYDDCQGYTRAVTVQVIPPDETTALAGPLGHDRCAAHPVPFSVGPVQPPERFTAAPGGR
jgi:hypothetical protein